MNYDMKKDLYETIPFTIISILLFVLGMIFDSTELLILGSFAGSMMFMFYFACFFTSWQKLVDKKLKKIKEMKND